MIYSIDVFDEYGLDNSVIELVKTAVDTTLNYLEYTDASLSLLLTDDQRLQILNRNFRQIDSATDVLSFPANDQILGDEGDFLYLGDIAISVPYAKRQAKERGHSYYAELQLLTVHGVLHLVGYVHFSQLEKKEMWKIQEQILTKLGLENITASIE